MRNLVRGKSIRGQDHFVLSVCSRNVIDAHMPSSDRRSNILRSPMLIVKDDGTDHRSENYCGENHENFGFFGHGFRYDKTAYGGKDGSRRWLAGPWSSACLVHFGLLCRRLCQRVVVDVFGRKRFLRSL